ncbi:DUF5107 domain-containing protein [Knoellia subterranea]|nr:DUF5107 domain-containing protein [Knoellia subterranea]
MVERIHRGRLDSPLPYGVVSDYDRAEQPLSLPAIELANDHVSATILPTLGGRVWSLTLTDGDKDGDSDGQRDLLHRNPRLRWANFGLTDAWFAGGIEWNLGSTGHTTLSNRPMHAAILDTDLGPVVRLWEWERTRDLVLQVDLWLDGAHLMASTRVTNPDPEPKPLYYWTNIAVPETAGTRVLVPATDAWRTDYSGMLDLVSVPHPDGPIDVSVPTNSRYAADYFFDVAHHRGRLVSAVEPDGRGFAQTSTGALRGRKLFLWGNGPGGQRWQDWLGVPGSRYLEIQAGVCTTQLEHDVLDGHDSLSWTEAFLPLDLDPESVAGDYESASAAVADAVHRDVPPDRLEAQHAQWLAEVADRMPAADEVMHVGSGWGRAELALRGAEDLPGTPFPELDDESQPLRRFAESGDPNALDAIEADRPTLPVISPRWTALLEQHEPNSTGWWLPYALGTGRHLAGDREGARTAYGRSIGATPTAVALRGLALLADDPSERIALHRQALDLAPTERRLTVELLTALRDSGRASEVPGIVAALPLSVRDHGRTQLLLAQALADEDRRDEALVILTDLEVPDLAEGDPSLSDMWLRLCPGEDVPPRLDFRMSSATQP